MGVINVSSESSPGKELKDCLCSEIFFIEHMYSGCTLDEHRMNFPPMNTKEAVKTNASLSMENESRVIKKKTRV